MNKTSNSHIAFNLANFPGSLREEREEKIEKSNRKKIKPIFFFAQKIINIYLCAYIINKTLEFTLNEIYRRSLYCLYSCLFGMFPFYAQE